MALPGRRLFWLVGNHSRRHQPRLLLRFEQAPAGARRPGRAQPAPPSIPAAPPAHAGPAPREGEDGARVTRTLLCLVAGCCLSSARWFLIHHPPSCQTGRRGAICSPGEGASLWPAGPCQPSGKGTARGVSSQLLLGETTPAQAENWQFPLGLGWLCLHQPCTFPCWLGASVLPTSPLCPTTPYVPPAKEPPPRWAPATLTVSSLREQ